MGAITAIVLGGMLPASLAALTGTYLVPIAAFLGAWFSTLVLYRVATRGGRTSVATMLLAGIALGALAGAASGLLVYVADDSQLRDLTFWGLGSLAGGSWAKVAVAGPLIVIAIVVACTLGRGLNGLAMGEATAHHIGIPVQRMKNVAILTVAAAMGAARSQCLVVSALSELWCRICCACGPARITGHYWSMLLFWGPVCCWSQI